MLTRMESIKVGKAFEDDATTINMVAQALDLAKISLMDATNQFRPMSDVLAELGDKWDTIDPKIQKVIAGAVAGKMNARTYSNIWEYSLLY
jgi:hypothetical protein